MKDYETRYKALCYMLHNEFDKDGIVFAGFTKIAQDLMVAMIAEDNFKNDEEINEEYRKCYYKTLEEMDIIYGR